MPVIEAVIFDLDDTLYPEREYVFSGFSAVAREFAGLLGNPDVAAAEMRDLFESPQRPRVFNSLLARRNLNVDLSVVHRMIHIYRNHSPTIALYSDADALLTRLRKRGGLRLGLISDGFAVSQNAKIGALGLRGRLDAIVLTDELGVGVGKPHPRGFERIVQQLGCGGPKCMYVADNPAKDFVAPNILGWVSVRVCRSDGIYFDTPTAAGGNPTFLIESLCHLDRLLNGLG